MGGRQVDGGKGFLENDGSAGPGGLGLPVVWRGPPSPMSLEGLCPPRGWEERGPCRAQTRPGQTLRALPHISASLGVHQSGSK